MTNIMISRAFECLIADIVLKIFHFLETKLHHAEERRGFEHLNF
jgi:hypothetical protein